MYVCGRVRPVYTCALHLNLHFSGGCFGTVYRGVCRGKEVAVKKLFKQNVDPKILEDFKKEVRIMRLVL